MRPLLAQRYRLERRLGEGGLGTAYAAWDEALGVERALKLVSAPSPEALEQLRAEYQRLLGLRHPRLLRVHDFGVARLPEGLPNAGERSFYFTADLVAGAPLAREAPGRRWPELRRALVDAACALAALHRAGIAHGDVKPDNLLVSEGRGTLIDLSCARRFGEDSGGRLYGTLGALAPERLLGAPADAPSDVYAFGKLLEHCAAQAGAPWPSEVLELMRRATASHPAARPQSAEELAEALGASAHDLHARSRDTAELHGRAQELERALEALRGALAGVAGPRLVVLRGEPGSGRSRLLRELLWRVALEARTVEGFASRGEGALRATLGRALEQAAPLPSELEPGALLAALSASEEPLVVAFDDVERLAEEDRALLGAALEGTPPGARRAWLLTAPPGWRPEAAPALLLDLAPLGDAAVRAWAAELGIAEAAETLLRGSGGHPGDVQALATRVQQGEADTAEAMRRRRAAFAHAEARHHALPRPSAAEALELAEAFEEAGAPERALALLDALALEGLGEGERALVVARRAACRTTLGRAAEALAELEAAAVPSAVEPRGALLEARARALLRLGRSAEALGCAEAGLALELPAAARAELLEVAGVAASYGAEHERAAAYLGSAVALQQGRASPRRLVRLLSYQGIVAFRAGDVDAALAGYERALAVAEQGGVVEQIARGCLNAGTARHQRGQYAEALELYRRGERIAAALGQGDLLALFEFNLAKLYADVGAWSRAEGRARRAERAARRQGADFFVAAARSVLADVALARGDAPGAMALFTAARDAFREQGASREAAEEELELARAALAMGALAEAERALEGARALGLDAQDLAARGLLLEASLRRARGDVAGAEALVQPALRHARASGSVDLLARAHLLAGEGARAAALWSPALAALPEALRAGFRAHPARRAALEPPPTPEPPAPPERSGRLETLERLLGVFRKLNSSLETAEVLTLALDAAVELTGAERGFIVLRASETGALTVPVARHLDREQLGSGPLELSRSIAEQAIASAQPVVTVDAASDARFSGNASVHAMRLRSVIVVPIRSAEGVLGALYLDNRFAAARFGVADVDLLMAFADQLALALGAARRVEELRARTRELERERARVQELARGQAREIDRLEEELKLRQEALEHRHDFSAILGRGPAMRRLLATLDRVIDAPVPVLVLGESGTGKELVARAIHYQSPRRGAPFVSLNCAALPATLIEAELFGYVRGAFTGAERDRVGLIAQAKGGTLLLDELGELPLEVQAKLLRVLQEREVQPLGAATARPVDFRLVGATNRALREQVARGLFRQDLYYRVGVVEVTLPPLRERLEDLPVLAAHFIERAAQQLGRPRLPLRADALRRLLSHPWPGNVRELENVLTKAVLLADGPALTAADLDLPSARRVGSTRRRSQADERAVLLAALEDSAWNAALAARRLGMSRATLYRRLHRHGLARP